MFTGIIEEIGKIRGVNKGVNQCKITIECTEVLNGTKIGDSIAVNGVCLTVVEILSDSFVADVSPETLTVTSIGKLQVGDRVNLERAMKADGRFGGPICFELLCVFLLDPASQTGDVFLLIFCRGF